MFYRHENHVNSHRQSVSTRVVAGFMLWLSVCATWGGQSVTLAWNATSESNVAGYAIYYGNTSGNYSTRIDTGTQTTATIAGLKEGQTNYFTVTAYNAAGVESSPAGELAYIVPGLITLTPGANPGDPAIVQFPVASSHWYEVQASSDLKSWVTIQKTATATSNVWGQVLDPQSGAFPIRYYRLVMH